MKYFRKIQGEKVYLSPMNINDYEIYTKWLNNKNITQYLSVHNSLINLENEKVFLEEIVNREFCLAIIRDSDDTLLGNVSIEDIDYKNGTATLGVFIGEEENLSKGYGSEAIKLITKFGFDELRLHNIMLTVISFNDRAMKAYSKCGFKEFGRRHDAIYRDGKYYDLVYMELINNK